MSFKAISWAWEQTTGSPGRKAVLMACAQFADERGACWPSQAYIAKYTEQSERTVREHLGELERAGFIARASRTVSGRHSSDTITLNLARQISPAANFADGEKPQLSPAIFARDTVIDTVIKKKGKSASAPEGISFDFSSGTFHGLTDDHFSRFSAAFPATDPRAEVLRAAIWLATNPKNTKSNYLRFLSSWLSRAQDRAPRATPTSNQGDTYAAPRPARTAAEKRDEWTEAFNANARRVRARAADFIDAKV